MSEEMYGQRRNADGEIEIDLVELFFALLHNWKLLLIGLFAGAIIATGLYGLLVKASFMATTELYVTNLGNDVSIEDLRLGDTVAEDYKVILKSRGVLSEVIENLGLGIRIDALAKMVDVTKPTGTHILRIKVTAPEPEMSMAIANELATVSAEQIENYFGAGKTSVIDYADPESVQNVTPGRLKYTAVGGLLGFMAVAALLCLRFMLDTTIKSDDDVEKYLGLPLLVSIPYYRKKA